MEDVGTRRGADVASDHHLTTGQTALQRFNTAFLRDTDKLNEFKIALNNRFQALQDLLKEEEKRFNTAFLRDTDKLNEFKIALNNRVQALQDLLKEEETSMEDN
ncbi:unnamed protein product [Schistosoma margrebowiei]|uniref:Uncharacterized protein n=1 Tax=Schistosoma margrebowiei TaxID=48269 RepID=A0A183N790_9TREM|nr:unnamed protein product [Schistosoma margrebowiei]